MNEAMPLTVVREAFLGAMQESGLSQRFLAGMVNFCTLMPMRAIPFKVVCILGMNDGKYPRSRLPLDFDLMGAAGAYRPGDRSRREDDRYLFLEALLSAREKIYISYIGRNVRDNSVQMPSVLVGQLRDYLAAGWRQGDLPAGDDPGAGEAANLLAHLTCLHPLQPFSKAYFLPDRDPGLFTYAHEWREILDSQVAQPPETPLPGDILAPRIEGVLQLNDLIWFLKSPVQTFFNRRLKVYFDEIDITSEDQEPFGLDRLAPFNLGTRLLAAGLAAVPEASHEAVHEAAQQLRRSGCLPLNGFGDLAVAKLTEPVLRMIRYHHNLCNQWPDTAGAMEIRLSARNQGRIENSLSFTDLYLEDWLDGLRRTESGESGQYARWEFYCDTIMESGKISRLAALVGSWVKHLAGCAQGLSLTSYLVAPDGVAELRTLDQGCTEKWLDEIRVHWESGLIRPLPVTAKTALAYLAVMHSDDPKTGPEMKAQKAVDAARMAYQGNGFNSSGELGYSRYLARTYPDFAAVWQSDGIQFKQLATALYAPLLQAIRIHEIA
jgi:exodeoxyribonuclease V gamma subunit